MYSWKIDKDGKVLDVPVDLNNHYCDSLRYSLDFKIQNTAEWKVIEFKL
jgi:phage terminase large subunit